MNAFIGRIWGGAHTDTRHQVLRRTLALLISLTLVMSACAFSAFAVDPLEPGAGLAVADTAVFSDQSCVGLSLIILPAMTEVEILETAAGAVRIAYYNPDTLIRQTGWIPDDGSLLELRSHLIPGPYYQNVHPDADVLSEPRTNAVLLSRLSEGADIEIVQSTSDWVRIVFRGVNNQRALGWVVRSYIIPKRETPAASPVAVTISGAEATPQPIITMITISQGSIIESDNVDNTPDDPAQAEPTATPTPTQTPPPPETNQPSAEFVVPVGAHTVTLNAPNPEKPTRLTSRPDPYAMSYGDYYNGVMGEYLSYDPTGFVKVRIGTAEGYWPAEYVWVDAPRGMIPSAIPSAQVAQMGTRLNMRAHPNTSSDILAQYMTDQPLEVLAIRGDWVQVRVDGLIGYVAGAYVVKMVNRYVDPNTIPVNPAFNGTFDQSDAEGVSSEGVSSTQVPPSAPTPEPSPDPTPEPIVTTEPTPPSNDNPVSPETPGPDAITDPIAAATPSIADTMRPPDPPESLPPYAVVNPVDGARRLPMLERPDAESRVLCQYNKGVIVTIDAIYNAYFVRVHVGLTYGYMDLASLDTVNVPRNANSYADILPRRKVKRGSRPTIYAAPSTYSDVIGSTSAGATVVVLGVSNMWSHVAVSGRIGYIHNGNLN
ncbi:hypothetical protein FACS1894184_01090 [Clostridia bacterium]|nr:hypothetical protein FACS1894184_01090 [Clostridia bacterium]